jgi:hypothetical protein
MNHCSPPRLGLPRGATLDMLARIPDRFADGQFAGWQPASQLRSHTDELIATLDVQWVDPLTTRMLRLRHGDTSAWPIGNALFDICLTSPEGQRLYTTAYTLAISMGATRP